MKKFKDFKNAPVGATATTALGRRAMKIDDGEQCWITPSGNRYNDGGMVFWDYTLDPPAPTSAREALDLAWELAHEVKDGQVIPAGTRYLELYGSGLEEYTTRLDLRINSSLAPIVRTVEPLPEPLPEWLDAPAVLAECLNCNADGLTNSVHVNFIGERWACTECQRTLPWRDLRDVVPLYPKGQDDLYPSNSTGIGHEENNDD